MAGAFKASLGTGFNNTSGTTLAITTSADIAVGDLVVVRWAADNLSATTPTATCADGGNTYTVQRQAAVNATAAAGVAGGILTTKATVARPSGSAITLTFSGAILGKAAYAESFIGVDNTVRSAAVSATGTATAASAGASGTVNAGDLVLGAIANETRAAITGDSDTLNGSWSAQVSRTGGGTSGQDTTSVTIAGQYKIPTATGAQTYNVTAVAAEWVAMCVVLQATPTPAITQAAYRWYGEGTEAGAAALAVQDTAVTGDITNGDATGTLRIRLQSTTAVAVPVTDDWQLQYEKNASGTWTNVTAVSAAASTYDSPNLTNAAATTNRLTGGTGSFVAGKVSEDALMDDLGWGANNFTEIVYALKIKAADLASGDTLRFRVLRNNTTTEMTYTVTPTINLIKSVVQVNVTPVDSFHNNSADTTTLTLAQPGTVYTDDFNRADTTQPGLGSGWIAPDWFISANQAFRSQTGADDYALYNTDLGSPDHYVEANVNSLSGTFMCLNVRTSPAGRATNAYLAFIDPNNSQPVIGKVAGGGYADIVRGSAQSLAACRLRFEAEGTALRFYRDNVLVLSTTDPSLTTGSYTGLNSSANCSGYDNFQTASFVAGSTVNVTPLDTANSSTADTTTVTQTHVLAPLDTADANSADTTTIAVTRTVAPLDTANASAADTTTVTVFVTYNVTPLDTANVGTTDVTALTQIYKPTPLDTANASSADTTTVTQIHAVTPLDTANASSADTTTISVTRNVTPLDTTNINSVDISALTQVHVVAPLDTANTDSTDVAVLTQAHALAPVDARHTDTSDTTSLTQVHLTAPLDTVSTSSTDITALAQIHKLTPLDTANTHINEGTSLSAAGATVPLDTLNTNTANQPVVTQVHKVAPLDTQNLNVADIPVPVVNRSVAPVDTVNTSVTDDALLTQVHKVTPADTFDAHTTDTAALLLPGAITPLDTFNVNSVDTTTVAVTHHVTPLDTVHAASSDTTSLVVITWLTPASTVHTHGIDQAVLTQEQSVVPSNTVNTHRTTSSRVARDEGVLLAVGPASVLYFGEDRVTSIYEGPVKVG